VDIDKPANRSEIKSPLLNTVGQTLTQGSRRMNRRTAVKAVAMLGSALASRTAFALEADPLRRGAYHNPFMEGGGGSGAPSCCPVVELRQYTLHPGKRDVLIDLFEREFIETQEAVGITVIGHFRDLEDPNRFVWLRGFSDMRSRGESLKAFYDGARWKSLRDSVNATIIDSDNVLLLHPARPDSGFALGKQIRPAIGAAVSAGLMVATLYYFDAPVDAAFVDFFEQRVKPELVAANASVLASLATESSPNTFRVLPAREGEHLFVWFSLFENQASYESHRASLARSAKWSDVSKQMMVRLKFRAPEVLRLSPASRSLLHT
jgi:quinol monooxygenase YgiN